MYAYTTHWTCHTDVTGMHTNTNNHNLTSVDILGLCRQYFELVSGKTALWSYWIFVSLNLM